IEGDGLGGALMALEYVGRRGRILSVPERDLPIMTGGCEAVRGTGEGHRPDACLVAPIAAELFAAGKVPRHRAAIGMSRDGAIAADGDRCGGSTIELDR